jgi:hypothetical protein
MLWYEGFCSQREGLENQRKKMWPLDPPWGKGSMLLGLLTSSHLLMTHSLWVTEVSWYLVEWHYLMFSFVIYFDWLFQLQHVTDLSGRETLVRITGEWCVFFFNDNYSGIPPIWAAVFCASVGWLKLLY